MDQSERIAVVEEKAIQLDKKVDNLCSALTASSLTNGQLFGKLMERMNILILVMIVMSLLSGMNTMEAILKGLAIWK
jgi:hypothetical protein